MKQILLTGLASLSAAGMVAATPQAQSQTAAGMSEKAIVKSVRNARTGNAVKKLAPGVTLSTSHGMKRLHSVRTLNRIAPSPKSSFIKKAEAPEGYIFFESFEDWNGEDINWTPEGWTVEMRGNVERGESWTPGSANPGLPAPSDGDAYYGINFSMGQQDEWLITPEVTLAENMALSYWLYLEPLFLYKLDNVDWDTSQFIGDKEVAATLQIWVQPEGGEWEMIHDYADDFADFSLDELMMSSPMGLEKKTDSLAAYSGKKVKVAFRYVGTDGNTMFIDAVGIGYPALEGISYMDPFSTLYWGFDRSWQMAGLVADFAMYPVYQPLSWMNMAYIEDAEFTWEYCDPITAEMVTTDEDPDLLTVEYVPDYRSAASLKNNFFYPPTLHATAPNSTPASYTAPYVFFQAGGKPERTLNDGTELEVSLLPFAFNNVGMSVVMVDDEQIGDPAIPVFGHNANTDRYWLNYSLNGEEPMEGDYSHLEGIANMFFATEAPLVVNGMTVYGFGQIDADAELTAVIYALNEEMSADFTTFTEIASTTIKGSDIIAQYSDDNGYLTLPFDFESPVVVRATLEHPAYVFMLRGFNSDKVKYFAPLQSGDPDPNNLCLGYILNHIDLSNHIADRPAYYSFKPMVYKVGEEYVDPYGSFAIGINGEYPWLTTDCDGINLGRQGKVEVALGSYFDGSKLSVDVPAGVTASVSGRYNECVLTVEHNDAEVIVDGNIVVSGPGVEVTIPVKEDPNGISSVVSDDSEVEGIYNLSGNRVGNADKGVYIVKYSDGSVRKTIIR